MKRFIYSNIANFITFLRLVFTINLIALFIDYFNYGSSQFVVSKTIIYFALIAASDLLDGKLARKLGIASSFGAHFDFIVDSIYVFSTCILMCFYKLIPIWFVILVVDKTVNYIYTSHLYRVQKKDKFSFIKDNIGRWISALYFVVAPLTFVVNIVCAKAYILVWMFMMILGGLGIVSSIYRYQVLKKVKEREKL